MGSDEPSQRHRGREVTDIVAGGGSVFSQISTILFDFVLVHVVIGIGGA